MILFCLIFIILVGGYSAISGSPFQLGESATGLVVSYYAWTMMLSVYTCTGYIVYQNKQHGTLENVISNTRHYTVLLICESIVSSAIYFLFSWLIIDALTLIYGIKLHFLVFSVFAIIMIGLLSVLGLKGISLLQLSSGSYMTLLANSLTFLAVGILVFQLCLKGAKRKGSLGFY